jgi:hypothetical protein
MPMLGPPTKDVSIPAKIPATMVLPVATDTNGREWPGAGFVWQRMLSADTLLALGITVRWERADGSVMDRDTALKLIGENAELVSSGHNPQFAANDPMESNA